MTQELTFQVHADCP